ncbi:hypothetical protein O181_023917 [Austropuccinia psidii MF-1]|uniref:Uncharacterized protein n=1 Tax=Austropuccinia psidii MF-1 TaxID=1389203 RepID=A0A9Q3CKG4_9BASI|nr:hypothetical protein [Austropuccinia psidii MF-1]
MFTGINYVQCTNEAVFNVEAMKTHEEVHISPTNQQTNSSFENTPSTMSTETSHELQLVRYVDQSQGIYVNTTEEGENSSTISPLEPILSPSKRITKGLFLMHAQEFQAILDIHSVITRDQWTTELSYIHILYRNWNANLHEDEGGIIFPVGIKVISNRDMRIFL